MTRSTSEAPAPIHPATVRNFALEYGLKLGGKIGKATGEHSEVVGAIMLLGLSGVMAAGCLLPGRQRGLLRGRGQHPGLYHFLHCHGTPGRNQPSVLRSKLSASLAPPLALHAGIGASSAVDHAAVPSRDSDALRSRY